MDQQQHAKPMKPKTLVVKVTENGKLTANVRIPFIIVKMGMKFGQMELKAKEGNKDELERLKDIDFDSILEALNSGELSLPCILVDVDEPAKNEHVTIILE
jgi:hypothetical protein